MTDPRTTDVRLVQGTIDSFEAELVGDHRELARLLEVGPIEEWPPTGGEHDADAVKYFRATLLATPEVSGWLASYVCVGSRLVGSAGFMGPPQDGTAEIGYSTCLIYRRQGIATRTVGLLVERAQRAGVRRLIARTKPTNVASLAVLERNGFRQDRQDGDRLLLVRDL